MNPLVFLSTIFAITNAAWIGQPFGGPFNQGYQPVYGLTQQNPEFPPLWPRNVISQQNWDSPAVQDFPNQDFFGQIGSEANDDIFRKQLLAHETTEEVQQRQLVDFITKMEQSVVQPVRNKTNETLNLSKASQMAQELLQQSRQAELAQLQESLQELQQPTSKSIWALPEVSKVQQLAHEKAVQGLKGFISQYQVSKLPESQDNLTKLLNETLQVAIKGQMAIYNLQTRQQSVNIPSFLTTDQLIKNFTSDLQQLLAVNNLFKTQNALVEYQMEARQIGLQQNFLTRQIRQLQAYQLLLSKQNGTLPAEVTMSFQKSQQEMLNLQQRLQAQQIAQQMIISRLQQVLISQRITMRQQRQTQTGNSHFLYGQTADNLNNALFM